MVQYPRKCLQSTHSYTARVPIQQKQFTSGLTYNQISQVTGGNYPLPPSTDIHIPPAIPPPPPLQQYQDVCQVTQLFIYNNLSQMTNVTSATGSILGGLNKQAYLRSQNNNREIRNVLSKCRIGKAITVPEPPVNTVAMDEADTNADTCCLGTNFIPLAYTNQWAYVYSYNDAYDSIKMFPLSVALLCMTIQMALHIYLSFMNSYTNKQKCNIVWSIRTNYILTGSIYSIILFTMRNHTLR